MVGDISIELITTSKKVEEELSYYQSIKKSPHIEAVVEVTRIIESDSLYAYSNIIDEDILIEFESDVDYKVGDRIAVTGSLELQ